MTLIEDWKQCWKFLSVQANTIGAAIAATYGMMFDHLKDTIPPTLMAMITMAVFILGIVGRVISQKKDATNLP